MKTINTSELIELGILSKYLDIKEYSFNNLQNSYDITDFELQALNYNEIKEKACCWKYDGNYYYDTIEDEDLFHPCWQLNLGLINCFIFQVSDGAFECYIDTYNPNIQDLVLINQHSDLQEAKQFAINFLSEKLQIMIKIVKDI